MEGSPGTGYQSPLQLIMTSKRHKRHVYAAFVAATLIAGCFGGDRDDEVWDPRPPDSAFQRGSNTVFASQFGSEVKACASESRAFRAMLTQIHDSGQPLEVAEDSMALLGEPLGRGFAPLLRIDLSDYDIFPAKAEIDSMLDDSRGPGYIFPYTTHCAALAHDIYEAFAYRGAHSDSPAQSGRDAERLRRAADLEAVPIENAVAFDYGHRVEAGRHRMDRIGHCLPDDREIHIIIERHSEIIHHRRSQTRRLEIKYNTGRGDCVEPVSGRTIDSWVSERPSPRDR